MPREKRFISRDIEISWIAEVVHNWRTGACVSFSTYDNNSILEACRRVGATDRQLAKFAEWLNK